MSASPVAKATKAYTDAQLMATSRSWWPILTTLSSQLSIGRRPFDIDTYCLSSQTASAIPRPTDQSQHVHTARVSVNQAA
ncbi:hypothetical protein K437DRAFT_10346 [Tilletiaria anomala UBC 951]|uniref:Uncharacterized protein n=1 Tax=Tilletiaria anomala (strain ATCC 24038 / CBS 436.72 / UBC 951) TaxID=1037660 RepID=A0A066VDH9_TILAU|nr:uncharacterized protein K437DRAFT_10346 [Tilletiaria anomala UBC 951]KDN39526.1 hypothetical protein K437DRAFT_10346 [Tilletiaria anomala UBC 951]